MKTIFHKQHVVSQATRNMTVKWLYHNNLDYVHVNICFSDTLKNYDFKFEIKLNFLLRYALTMKHLIQHMCNKYTYLFPTGIAPVRQS